MQLKVEIQEDVVLLNPLGDLMNRIAAEFSAERSRLMDEGYSKFIVDMQSVGLISSIGIRELIVLLKESTGKGGGLYLINLTTQVKSVLQVTGLLDLLKTAESIEEAKIALG